jgi:hypothetical protein
MKKRFLLLSVFLFYSFCAFSQVMGRPGATYVFRGGLSGQEYYKYIYAGDSISGADSIKKFQVTFVVDGTISGLQIPHTSTQYMEYFKVSGDTVWRFISAAQVWTMIANFSYQTGDTVPSPLHDLQVIGMSRGLFCDSEISGIPAVVTDGGTEMYNGVALRWYTLTYVNHISGTGDTVWYAGTFRERRMSSWWHVPFEFACGMPCSTIPAQLCYSDEDMEIGDHCNDLWFETLSADEITEESVQLYPNPASDQVFLSMNGAATGQYSIVNLQGQELLSGVLQHTALQGININGLRPGLYLVKIRSGKNIESVSRFIKE